MKNKNAVVTIVANNYMGFALTLCDSLKNNENLDIYILIADGLKEEINYSIYPYKYIDVKELEIERIEELAFKYDVVEFSTALKPFALEYLMDKKGYEKVFYIDPDICFFDTFDTVTNDLGEHSVMLTPHLTDPTIGLENSLFERVCLINGTFNLGFIGFNNNQEAHAILHWWQERLMEFCYNDEKYFTDQKWINLIPTLFEDVYICRKKTYNFAEWNFYERNLIEEENKYYIVDCGEKSRLCFAHFSGYKATDPVEFLSKETIIVDEEAKKPIISLFSYYRSLLELNDFPKYSKVPYCHNTYDNGVAIMEIHRRLYRKLIEKGYQIVHPFSTKENSFYALLKKNGLIIQETNTKNTVFDNSQVSKKSGLIQKMNGIMRLAMHVVGIKRYCMLIRYFCHYCTVDDQLFLLKNLSDKDKIIGE